MRRIGTLSNESLAQRFCDYLVTLAIEAATDPSSDDEASEWNIWIRDEKHVERARKEFQQFEQSPDGAQYQVEDQAVKIREEKIAAGQRRLKNQRELSKKLPPASGGLGPMSGAPARQQNIPVTIGIIIVSVVASFVSNFGRIRQGEYDPNNVTLGQRVYFDMRFVDFIEYAKDKDPFVSIKDGQVWRILTPMFLHGDEFHIAFNMLWIFFLGSAIERLHGSLFLALLAFGTHIFGMLVQVLLPEADFLPESLHGSPFAIGASGAVYGLFGFLWIRPNLDPSYPIRLVPMNVALMLGWLVLCMTPAVQNVANGAHLGGLLAGILAAVVATRLSDQ